MPLYGLEALNIQAWRTATESKSAVLHANTRHLHDALGTEYSESRWARTLKWVRRCRRTMGFAEGADHRIIWAAALAASQGDFR